MKSRGFVAFIIVLASLCWGMDAAAATKSKRKKSKKRSRDVTVTADVGVGPAGFFLFGPVMEDQTLHYGLRLDVIAIIPEAVWKKELRRRPKKQRKIAAGWKGEVRMRPLWFLPSSLIISPKTKNTGVYGVNFRPFGLGLALSKKPRFDVSAGLALSYAYVDSDTLPDTHFLRPGLDLKAELELPLSKKFVVSVGWASTFYPPQELGGDVFEWGDIDNSIWHIGQAFVVFHYRFPYTHRL